MACHSRLACMIRREFFQARICNLWAHVRDGTWRCDVSSFQYSQEQAHFRIGDNYASSNL